MLSKYIVVYR